MTDSLSATPVSEAPGRLTALLVRLLFRQATVSKVETLSEHFRRITLVGDALKSVAWAPGAKIQISVGGGANRTYTPIAWDSVAGQTQILVFTHGDGPGSAWASTVQEGEACAFFGPRRSLDLERVGGDLGFLFGDETAFGSALAFASSYGPEGAPILLFEVSSVAESERVWRSCSPLRATFIPRAAGETHLNAVAAELRTIISDWAPDAYILSGKASSIRRVRGILEEHAIARAQTSVKAYWAAGKKGLD